MPEGFYGGRVSVRDRLHPITLTVASEGNAFSARLGAQQAAPSPSGSKLPHSSYMFATFSKYRANATIPPDACCQS